MKLTLKSFIRKLIACLAVLAALSVLPGTANPDPAPPVKGPLLTWSGDPETTQAITWLMPGTCDLARVQYLKEDEFTGSFAEAGEVMVTGRTFGASGYDNLFSTNLTGLEPGTRYIYRVGDGNDWSRENIFTTAIDSTCFHFLYLGDIHAGYDAGWDSRWGDLLASAYTSYPGLMFSLQGGDVTDQDNETGYRQLISAAAELFSRIPFMPAMGNHDNSFFLNFFDLPRNGPASLEKECYSFNYGNAHFVVLNSACNTSATVAEWLRQDLQNSHAKWKFVVFHHPAYYAFADGKTSIYESVQSNWVPILEQYGVDLAFIGHQHVYMRTKPLRDGQIQPDGQGVVYVMGVAGTKLYNAGPGYDYVAKEVAGVSNYQVVSIDGDLLTLTSIQAGGQVIDTYQIDKKIADAPAPVWAESDRLTATISGSDMTLRWPAATSCVAVTGYRIYQDGALAGVVPGDTRSYTITGISAGNKYTFKVEAGNAAGKWSADGPDCAIKLPGNIAEPVIVTGADYCLPKHNDTVTGLVYSDPLPQIKLETNTPLCRTTPVQVEIPAGATVTAPGNWDGIIHAPAVGEAAVNNATVSAAIEVGFSGGTLDFDRAVKLLIPGQAGKKAGYIDNNGTFQPILTDIKATDSGAATAELAAKIAREGKQDDGDDLLIWTRHFTKFVTYTQDYFGGGGGGGSASVSTTSGSAKVRPSAGGTIGLGEEAKIKIPAGALNGVSSVEVKVAKVTTLPKISASFRLLGNVYEFSVDNNNSYNFKKDVTVTLSFDSTALLKGETPAIYYYDEAAGQWVKLGGTVSGDTVIVEVDHFTKFAVMAAIETKVAPEPEPDVQEEAPEVTGALTDIAGHWAENNIKKLVATGAVSGYPDATFKPENKITRAEFAAILVKAFGLEDKDGKIFTDTAGHWAQDYIAAAVAGGVASGYDADTFGPDNLITREQMAVLITKAAKLSPVAGEVLYGDSGSISDWAKEAAATATENGIMKGYPDNTFQPQGSATRAEAVTVIVNAIK
ncbi:MAG: S-layer homology domain-containing protein [Desulfotomaculaceae bacterium]|nr:S-layer homology domain-containing protein [Desulfotomaculaceae bacterium]